MTAKDFVNGLKHAADKKSEAMYLAENSVKAWQIIYQELQQIFQQLVSRRLDDYTLQYTLNQPEPFWNSS